MVFLKKVNVLVAHIKNPKVLVVPVDVFACGYYRIIEPYQWLIDHDGFHEIDYIMHDIETKNALPDFEEETKSADAIIIQRVAFPNFLAICERAKARGVKLILDLDDHFFKVNFKNAAYPVWAPGSAARKTLVSALDIIDQLHVSTPELVSVYSPFTRAPIHVIFNALDMRKYQKIKSMREIMPQDKVILMWSGSTTHDESLNMITDVLSQIISKNKNLIFAICGNKEFLDRIPAPENQKFWMQATLFKDYHMIPSHADVYITPVKESDFNDAKSELKCLEAAIWHVPCVSSPVAPYMRFNSLSNGGNLLAKGNRINKWINSIQSLIDDLDLRKETGEKAFNSLEQFYSLEKTSRQRHELVKSLF